MTSLLSNAAGPDTSDSNLVIEVIALMIIAATCILAAIPIVISRRRRLGVTEGISALMVIWGVLSAGSAIYVANAHTLAETRFFDPTRVAPPIAPWTWMLWAALAVMYGGTVIWALAAKPYVPPPPAAGFEVIAPSPPGQPKS